MEDAGLVSIFESLGELPAGADGLVHSERTLGQAILKGTTFQILENEKSPALFFSHVQDTEQIGVIEFSHGPSLPQEALIGLWFLAEFRGKQLDGNPALELGVFGEPDFAHGTTAQMTHDFIM
jgi:hypothetical protein